MRITIDNQIKGLEYLKKCRIFPFSDTRTGIVFTEECINDAIYTMRKYQKIEKILDDCDLETWEKLEKIKEVRKCLKLKTL